MSKKIYTLISSLVGAAGTASCAIIAYCEFENSPAIISSVGVAVVAVNDILLRFVKE